MATRGWGRPNRTRSERPADEIELRGEVATLRLLLQTGPRRDRPDGPWDDIVVEQLTEKYEALSAELTGAVRERLGEGFEVTLQIYQQRSVEIIAVIAAAYGVISTYGAVRNGLDYLIPDLTWIVRRLIPARVMGRVASSAVIAGPGLVDAEPAALSAPQHPRDGVSPDRLVPLLLAMIAFLVAALCAVTTVILIVAL